MRAPRFLLPVSALLLFPAGCATDPDPAASAAGTVQVDATDDRCAPSRTELPAGVTTLSITNGGRQVTEVYVYDGDRIVTEKENIGPGTSYDLAVDLPAGSYVLACKPGMVGEGIRTELVVSGEGRQEDPAAAQAAQDYRDWVTAQADALVPAVEAFAAAVKSGDVERAKALYAPSREPWERIEPVAESFGDLDPRMDAREADLAAGEAFTGWHRLEKALWTGEDLAALAPVADQLVADATELRQRVPNAVITATSVGNGAKELLDEVATGKITGEEEAFSHTDLVDFSANVEGAAKAFEVLRPLVEQNAPELATQLDERFVAVDAALARHRDGDGFASYDTVEEVDRRELARVVDALSEPLSRLSAAAAA
ncbi:iron uptake system protein EfeO [Georgenia ruanii]|uniref:Peptidase M75 n=1 Tax=Georgenia ruanii TaxID=348442 RepID=A0A7J9V0H4_9MICO|nr:iron uptake system protein EfeO [Georgenia ruanii]MPV90378.1 peptidase M75 [Georgenia ruanii]